NTKYILHIKIKSSVDSILQVFYSDNNQQNYPYSEKNTVQSYINKGDNDIYILLDYPNLGKHLRLDPIVEKGEIFIKILEMKKI
ncbi:hypothetical protein QUF61_14960, partial [Candidatus Venteria ishoeyi]